MEKINLNMLARDVAILEGGDKEANIAEIKQIQGIVLDELAKFSDEQIIEAVRRKQTYGAVAEFGKLIRHQKHEAWSGKDLPIDRRTQEGP